MLISFAQAKIQRYAGLEALRDGMVPAHSQLLIWIQMGISMDIIRRNMFARYVAP